MNVISNEKLFMKNLQEITPFSSFDSCIFDNCYIGKDSNIDNLECIKSVQFNNCKFIHTYICTCLLEGVVFENVSFMDYGRFMSTLFNRVIFKGKFNSFSIQRLALLGDKNAKQQMLINNYRENFYKNIDWAIDISQAKLSEFYCDSIPTNLIIRDPDTQFVISKNNFNDLDLLDVSFRKNFKYLTSILEDFLNGEQNEMIIAVPLSKPKSFKEPIINGLKELKAMTLIN